VNGSEAKMGDFPWMVMLNDGRCGGVLIQDDDDQLDTSSSSYVLTASHCLMGTILKWVQIFVEYK